MTFLFLFYVNGRIFFFAVNMDWSLTDHIVGGPTAVHTCLFTRMQTPANIFKSDIGWKIGCSILSPHSRQGMGSLRENERGGKEERVQRLSQASHSTGREERERESLFQILTSVIRLYRAGKKIAGSVLVMAEHEKSRRLNKKTCVAHALWLIGCIPWISTGRCCQLDKCTVAVYKKWINRACGLNTDWLPTKLSNFVLTVFPLKLLLHSLHIGWPTRFPQRALKAGIICYTKCLHFALFITEPQVCTTDAKMGTDARVIKKTDKTMPSGSH